MHRSRLDPGLFDAPIAALAENTGPQPAYLAEHHVTEFIPGVGFWVESRERLNATHWSSLFVGVGDPIYNAADPRLPKGFLGKSSNAGLVLPRLVASSDELDACARALLRAKAAQVDVLVFARVVESR